MHGLKGLSSLDSGIEPIPPAVEAQSPSNHWIPQGIPAQFLKWLHTAHLRLPEMTVHH